MIDHDRVARLETTLGGAEGRDPRIDARPVVVIILIAVVEHGERARLERLEASPAAKGRALLLSDDDDQEIVMRFDAGLGLGGGIASCGWTSFSVLKGNGRNAKVSKSLCPL